jgi:hypothetical protein
MARVSKQVKLYQDIQQNPELRSINAEVNQINDMIARMGRSEYFKGISLPEQVNKYSMVESAKDNFAGTKEYLESIKNNLDYIWNIRRNEDSLEGSTGVISSDGKYFKTIDVMPESALKRSEKTGRGQMSEKAVRNMIADDIEMLRRLTGKPENLIVDFLNKWYESPAVSGGQLLEKFIDAVYKSNYAGQGASQSWGSPPPKRIIEEKIVDAFDISVNYDDAFNRTWSTESAMGDELFSAWMKLFE